MIAFIKRLLCSHYSVTWLHIHNARGDEINEFNGHRSIWKCKRCGAIIWRELLENEK